MIRIAFVDDKQINRTTLEEKFSGKPDIKIVFSAANGEEFLEKMKNCNELPELVFMDIDMPVMDGIKTVNIASTLYPSTHFLMLTVFDDDEKIFEAIKAGAIGYLLKEESGEQLMKAIEEVIAYGGSPMSPRIARKTLQLLSTGKSELKINENEILSERESEILKALVDDYDHKKIADIMFISPHTVRTHITNIYKKLHVNNRTQAVKLAIKNKWFSMF